jgi:hypothetical protein
MYWVFAFCICAGIYRGLTRDNKISVKDSNNELDFFEWLYIK